MSFLNWLMVLYLIMFVALPAFLIADSVISKARNKRLTAVRKMLTRRKPADVIDIRTKRRMR